MRLKWWTCLAVAGLVLTGLVTGCAEDDDGGDLSSCLDPVEALERSAGGLCGEVTVRRSATGLAHIEADGMHDLLWAQGYEMAADRIFHMDHFRRFTYGTRAEVYGPRFEADDRVKRVIGLQRVAEAGAEWYRENEPETHALLQAYSNGVNAWLAHMQVGSYGAARPTELDRVDPAYVPDPWTPTDIVAILKIMIFGQTFQGDTLLFYFASEVLTNAGVFADLVRFAPLFSTHILEEAHDPEYATAKRHPGSLDRMDSVDWTPDPRLLGLDDHERQQLGSALLELSTRLASARGHDLPGASGGSNAWAISGEFTDHGGSILCNDPHMGPDLPSTLYPIHLVDRTLDDRGTFGFGVPGLPLMLIGTNGASAWGMTNAFGDVTDIVREQLVDRGRATRTENGTVPLEIREEVIRVRREGGGLSDVDEVIQVVRVVPGRGPILNDILPPQIGDTLAAIGYTFSTLWTGFRPDTGEPMVMQDIFRARTLDEKIESLRQFDGGIMSFTFADNSGDIAYVPAGPYPVRNPGVEDSPPYRFFEGDNGEVWSGFLPFDEIPRAVRPDKGYTVNANNAIGPQTLDNRPEQGGFYFGHFFDLGTRAWRISDVIESWRGQVSSLDDNTALQTDAHAAIAQVYLPHLLPLIDRCDEQEAHARRCEAMELLEAWDLQQRRDSAAASIYNAFFVHFAHNVYSAHFDSLIYPLLGGFLINLAGRTLIRLLDDPTVARVNYFGDGEVSREQIDSFLLASLDDALTQLEEHFGPETATEDWLWGGVHELVLRHHVWPDQSLGPVPMDGSVRTVLAADFPPIGPDGNVREMPWRVNEMSVMRYCTELRPDGTSSTRAVVGGGVGGHQEGEHYGDQFEAYVNNTFLDIPHAPHEVREAAVSTTVHPAGFGTR